jgi:hypothetical protein
MVNSALPAAPAHAACEVAHLHHPLLLGSAAAKTAAALRDDHHIKHVCILSATHACSATLMLLMLAVPHQCCSYCCPCPCCCSSDVGLVLNSILVAQILVYGNKGLSATKVKDKLAAKKAA